MSEKIRKTHEDNVNSNYIRFLSHQLKSPINSIQSLLNTISEGFTGEVNPKTLYFIEKAISRAAEAKEVIADLLDYELYSQNQSVSWEELDIGVLVNLLVNKYASRAPEKNISLQANLPLHARICILGDRRGLEQAFGNIIENAIKYTPPNQGIVTVTLSVSEEEQTCQISVTDTGYGIPEHELERIFDPFYRSIKHKFNISGTGLGLPIAKRVITSHKGTITVDSKENAGTTFRVVLPYTSLKKSEKPAAERKKVVIIGGTTSGPKAAARLRRLDEDLDIIIIEKSEFLSYSGCGLPSYIIDQVHSPKALMSTADNTIRDVHFFESIENITVLNNTVALEIDRAKKTIKTQNLIHNTQSELPYDVLILATGTAFFVPNIPGIWQKGIYSLHSLEEAEAIKKEFSQKNAQDVSIIGGGLIGTSIAESLVETGARATILEKQAHILFDLMDRDIALKIQHELNKKGIKIITDAKITKIEKTGDHVTIMTENDSYSADLIILATGVKPNTTLAEKAGLTISNSGGIQVTTSLQTSDEHIYAIGDCAESINLLTQQREYWPLGSISLKMGRIAADNICGRKSEFRGSISTAMFRIININVARTGLTLRRALEQKFNAEMVIVTGLDRAHFCEHAQYVTLKVIADKTTRVILGAQGYGKGDVISKIQILACAITQSMTLDDVFKLDLGYAPVFNTPIDLVQTACLVLNNKIEGLFKTITLEDFEREKEEAKGIIDVSPLSEHAFHSIPGSINIPLENIRLEGIPFDKTAKVILYSKTSSGAYKAYRHLTSKGYSNLLVLEGGYVYWER
jgi:NADPH-dependent 2,4-dienoyl-CoA reductase/sulfur reductase-like enzyme/rhodanese-related sulfurtransferase/anti-sigma regulatory factor (Ser/Thr protein kinase)